MSIINDMAAVLATVLPNRSGVYASAPITSGKRLFALRKDRSSAADDPKARVRLVVKPNLSDAHEFATRLGEKYPNRVIDPSRLPFFDDWTQEHYYRLWAEVVRLHTSKAVFIDGWEYSGGCTYEYVVATKCEIPSFNACLEALDPETGAKLMEDACSTLAANGQESGFLSERLRQLRLQGFPKVQSAEPSAPIGRRVHLCVLILGCVVRCRGAVVVASPIVDGKLMRAKSDDHSRTGRSRIHPALEGLEENRSIHNALMDRVRENTTMPVIDTSSFAPPTWRRGDLHRLWSEVTSSYARTVVLGENWQYSEDCLVTLRSSIQVGAEIVDHCGNPMTTQLTADIVRRAAAETQFSQRDSVLESLLESLSSSRDVA